MRSRTHRYAPSLPADQFKFDSLILLTLNLTGLCRLAGTLETILRCATLRESMATYVFMYIRMRTWAHSSPRHPTGVLIDELYVFL